MSYYDSDYYLQQKAARDSFGAQQTAAQVPGSQFRNTGFQGPSADGRWAPASGNGGAGGVAYGNTLTGLSTGNIYMAAAGAAVDLLKAGGDQRARATARHRGKGTVWGQIKPTIEKWYDKSQKTAEAIPGIVDRGYAAAKTETSEAFRGAATSAVERGQADQQNALASMSAQGLQSSSIYQNVRMGMGAQTSRLLSEIMGRLASAQAGLTERHTQAAVGAQQNLGQFYQAREVAENIPNMLLYQLRTQN